MALRLSKASTSSSGARHGFPSRVREAKAIDGLVGDLPRPGAIVTSAADRVELRGWAGSLKRHGEWIVPTRLALVRRLGSINFDLVKPVPRGR